MLKLTAWADCHFSCHFKSPENGYLKQRCMLMEITSDLEKGVNVLLMQLLNGLADKIMFITISNLNCFAGKSN